MFMAYEFYLFYFDFILFLFIYLFFVAPGLQMGTDWELANRIPYQFIVLEPGRNTSSHGRRNSTALASACYLNGG